MFTETDTRRKEDNILIWFNKYRIISMLTENVFLAEHIGLKEYRLVKRLDKKGPFYERLLNEAYILQTLVHKGIPLLKDIEDDEEYTYLVEEYIPGDTLTEYVQRTNLSRGEIVTILNQICNIILYLHKQSPPVFYLDLNPNNIIINADKEVFLVDYGASIRDGEDVDKRFQFGMRGFAAPEMSIEGKAGAHSDIYSIGCILYYMLKGKCYEGEKLNRFVMKEPPRLMRVLRSALREDPGKRPDISHLLTLINKKKNLKSKKKDIVCRRILQGYVPCSPLPDILLKSYEHHRFGISAFYLLKLI